MMMRSSLTASILGAAIVAMAPSEAHAQTVFASFRADYTWSLPYPDPANPIEVGPHRVRFTLYDDGTFVNDDGNGGEFSLVGNNITLWFFSRAEATAPYPPFGAATWEGTLNGGAVCNGDTRTPGIDPSTGYPLTIFGEWNTRGCP